jgi:starch synthase (maltosyl-transferring)
MAELPSDGRRRVIIRRLWPEIEGGRFPVKRVVGDSVVVEAEVIADGHDRISCRIRYCHSTGKDWLFTPMKPLGNDRWSGEFKVTEIGRYHYSVEGWIDPFETWRNRLTKRIQTGEDLSVELRTGAQIVEHAAKLASGAADGDAQRLKQWAAVLAETENRAAATAAGLDEELAAAMRRFPDCSLASSYERNLTVVVDREKARFSTWYELFPRSCSAGQALHGTFRDCEARLPYITSMKFDVIYLPPIHPIGHTSRKGRNNTRSAQKGDVGSPWAIGSEDGGHTSIHRELGSLEDFQHFLAAAQGYGLEVALDIAFQGTPDHPYTREHTEWFRKRPDGSIQYAENPPKKYEDIYPFDFECCDWQALWTELRDVLLFWVQQGVRIFRIDNPHTKAFPFWEWVIEDIKETNPEVLFLAEAFTRPSVMHHLAKLGFSQSYTYFTWRNTKQELADYFRELTDPQVRQYLRPNLWPNTPDILPEYLQLGGRPAFMIRLILAATLGASYGIYGPAFELCENTPREPGGEEYLNSEKYEIKHWDWNSLKSLKGFIGRVNRIRVENSALHSDNGLSFHQTDNPEVICYSKISEDASNIIVVVVNLDPFHTQASWVDLDLTALGISGGRSFQAHDLLGEGRYLWQGSRNFVQLIPESLPAHILRVRRWSRTERDFDYYL